MKRTFAIFAATTALTLGACGAPADDQAAATTTVTQEVTEDSTEEQHADNTEAQDTSADTGSTPPDQGTPPPNEGETPQEPEIPQGPEETREEFQQIMADEMRANGNIGDTFTIDGQATELCVHGDGYGLNIVSAGPNTSCDFARNVMNSATAGLNPTGDNVRGVLPNTIRAGSPVTNEAYDMTCNYDERNLITCEGGNNATVYMY